MRIHYVLNDSFSDLGTIGSWMAKKHHAVTLTKVNEETVFPSVDDFDMLIILGGRMGAYEEEKYPWLILEKQFILETISKHKFVLGICLGAQLIASALGGRAYPHMYKEIGWWPVELTKEASTAPLFKGLPDSFIAFLAHQDTFTLPEGAVLLASGHGCANQAFQYGDHVIGLQFHLEADDLVNRGVNYYGETLTEGPYIQAPSEILRQKYYQESMNEVLFTLLDNFEKTFNKTIMTGEMSESK